jgi:methionyl-tRNA formyltransferase
MTLRVGFAGTPPFAAKALDALVAAGFAPKLVLTQPDRPGGRGLKPQPSAVKQRAQDLHLALAQPGGLKDPAVATALSSTPLDVLVVAAYGRILPAAILAWPRLGCYNIHASLLPRWRGAAPIVRALLAGDAGTGVTIMRIDEGLDTGPIVSQHPVAIEPGETAGSLHDKLATVGADAMVACLQTIAANGSVTCRPQPSHGETYADKIDRDEAILDWRQDAVQLERRVRAFDPAPVARTTRAGEVIRIWSASCLPGRFGEPATIVQADARGITVACGEGALVIHALQPAGGRRQAAAAYLAGHPIAPGERLGA